jgi:GntR family transcriptional regulator of vanillate catabolism
MQLQSRDTLDTTVYLTIKEMIMNKQLKPNQFIVQNQLSQTMGVSRTPLRKALGQLEKEGLLDASPKGWYVKEFSIEDMISVFRIRAVLEGLACRLAANKLEAPDLAYMESMFEHAYKQVQDHQAEAYYKADVKFHTMITDAANDVVLKKTISSNEIIATSQMQGLYRDPHETFGEHLAIIQALRDREGLKAEQLMRSHIEKAIPILQDNNFSVYK